MPIEVSKNGALVSSVSNALKSEAVQEIVSHKPGFLIRYGITLFFVILISMIATCWFIKYPDLVSSIAKLTSLNAPKPVVCKTDGKLIKLLVKEGTTVNNNDVIGFVESTASHEEVIKLDVALDTMQALLASNKTTEIKNCLAVFSSPTVGGGWEGVLGELQQPYQSFIQAYTAFANYLQGGFYLQKKALLANDMENLNRLHNNLLQQKEMQQQDIALAQKTFDMNDTLKRYKIISDLEYRNEKSKLLNKISSLPQINNALISNEAQQVEKLKEIKELDNTITQQQTIFQQALNTFKSQVEDWKKRYLLIAPESGTVSYAGFIQENQQLKSNQTVCFINTGNTSYYAEITIPQSNFGKVKTGQEVLLKFNAYPDVEFGSVIGRVDFISGIPTDSGYMARISLPYGLITNYKTNIQYRDGLTANAAIITADMRLLQKFYYNIYKQIKR